MAEVAPPSPLVTSRAVDDTNRVSIDRSSDPRDEESPLPTPPTNSAPAVTQDSSRTAFDSSELRERVDGVLQSDIGVNTLLNRLKQSIASARDFSYFLRERSNLEEKHAQGLKKLCRSTNELVRRPESRQGSFALNYEEVTGIHDRMADHGLRFANCLHQMSDDLQEMCATIERGRKHWKHTGLSSEQRLQDAEAAMAKAKHKYDVLAEQYDRARTGDRQSGRFGLKTKSAAQQEEDLNRKVQNADADYAAKVQAAQASRQELITSLRPQAVRALLELIVECDSALTLQLQKFASVNENLLLGNGLCVSPLNNQPGGMKPGSRSLREVAQNIDNEKDFRDHILSFSNKAGTRTSEIKYEKHPTLATPKQLQPSSQRPQSPQQTSNTLTNAYPNLSQGPPGPPGAFDRSHRPPQSGQTSGVTPYQPQNRDGLPMRMSQNQYPSGPMPPTHHQSPQYLGAQIPQIPPHTPITLSGTNLDQLNDSPPDQPASFVGSERMQPGSDFDALDHPSQYQEDFQSRPPPGLNQTRAEFQPRPLPGSNHSREEFQSRPLQGPDHSREEFQSRVPRGPNNPREDFQSRPPQESSHSREEFQSRPPQGPNHSREDFQSRPLQGPDHSREEFQSRPPQGPNHSREDFQSRPPQGPNHSREDFQSRPPQGLDRDHRSAPQPPLNNAFGSNAPREFIPAANMSQVRRSDGPQIDLPPIRPVFGLTLDEIFRRDGTAVPSIVHQCTAAVESFGLGVEGIYRTSGSTPHIMEMKAMFDHGKVSQDPSPRRIRVLTLPPDSSFVDFRDPKAFNHDIASVTTLLKHFLRDMPDPLLTSAHYASFLTAAKLDDEIVRRDSLHAIVNDLPDPNYATLRHLTLHLHKVAEHRAQNRMTPSNLAIVFGPTLLGQQGLGQGNVRDAGWQARVVETIILNTFQIFDDDD